MYYTADLHTHSRYAEKCSPALCLETMYQWAQVKGIDVMSSGDFTHPGWFKELKDKLMPDGNGFYQLKIPRKPLLSQVLNQCIDRFASARQPKYRVNIIAKINNAGSTILFMPRILKLPNVLMQSL